MDGEEAKQALRALSPYERMDRYREYATSALERAEQADPGPARSALLDIAARWGSLAQDIERRLDLLN